MIIKIREMSFHAVVVEASDKGTTAPLRFQDYGADAP